MKAQELRNQGIEPKNIAACLEGMIKVGFWTRRLGGWYTLNYITYFGYFIHTIDGKIYTTVGFRQIASGKNKHIVKLVNTVHYRNIL